MPWKPSTLISGQIDGTLHAILVQNLSQVEPTNASVSGALNDEFSSRHQNRMPEVTNSKPFSASGEDAITQTLSVEPESTPSRDTDLTAFLEYYDIERTVQLIKDGDYRAVST